MPTTKKDSSVGSIECDLSTSTIFDLLANARRRHVLQYLGQAIGAVRVSDLADQLALLEGDHTHEQYERICTGLVHIDVPRLEAAGVLAYDPERETVELLEAADQLVPYLELATGIDSE